jgi:hypothetical protein
MRTKFSVFIAILAIIISQNSYCQSYKLEKHWWQPNGMVEAIAIDTGNQVVYLGGSFSRVDPLITYGVPVSLQTNEVSYHSDMPNGNVWTSVPDGSGGWFIGGQFTKVGDSIRNRIAHIDSYGKVTSRARSLGADGNVLMMHMGDSGKMYFGGGFTAVGNLKPYGGVFAGNSNYPELQFPQTNGAITAVISDNMGGWYMGGDFTKVDDLERSCIAHVDSNGKVSPFRIDVGGTQVNRLALTGNKLYISGYFQIINGVPRNGLAVVDISTCEVMPWKPDPNMLVFAMVVSGDTLYVGGQFYEIAGQARMGLVAFSTINDSLLAWNPDLNSGVMAVGVSGQNVYAGGYFYHVGDSVRSNIACIDAVTGIATSWKPSVNGMVRALKIDGNNVLIGGSFSAVNSLPRQCLASLDMVTGSVGALNVAIQDSFYASPNVSYIEVLPADLLIAGDFSHVGGQPLRYVAKIDKNTSVVSTWNPMANNAIRCFGSQGNKFFVGGVFTSIGGEARGRLALYNTITETLSNWNPDVDGNVWDIQSDASHVYIGGTFEYVGGVARNKLASVEKWSGLPTIWNPDVTGNVNALMLLNDKLYVGGYFLSVNNQARTHVASFDLTTGNLTPWAPAINGNVIKIRNYDSLIYVCGSPFKVLTFNSTSGALTGWYASAPSASGCNDIYKHSNTMYVAFSGNPSVILPVNLLNNQAGQPITCSKGEVYTLSGSGAQLYAGGSYTRIGGVARSNLAAISLQTGAVTNFNVGINHIVRTLSLSDSLLYFSGEFSTVNGQTRNRIAAVNKHSGLLTAWNPNLNWFARSIVEIDTLVYLGGYFNTVKGQPRNFMAAVGKTAGNPTPFNPAINSGVNKIIKRDSLLYIAGGFTTINGQTRNRLASMDMSGTLTGWSPDVDGVVNDIAIHDSLIYLAGAFTTVGGVTQNRLAALSVHNDSALIWTPSVNNTVDAVEYADSLICIAGNFTEINNKTAKAAAVFKPDSINHSHWSPSVSIGGARTIRKYGNQVFIGGYFQTLNGYPVANFAVFSRECYTAPSTEVVVACNSYKWINGITYFASTNTPYFSIMNADGCDSLINLHLTIVNTDTAVTVNGTTLAAGAGATSYQWLDCNNNLSVIPGQTNAVFTATTNGSYAVAITNGFCVDTSACFAVTSIGINAESSKSIKIFPNPTENEIFIETDDNSRIIQVEVFSAVGQLIYQRNRVSDNRFSVLLSSERGVYYIRIKDNTGAIFTSKVVKI